MGSMTWHGTPYQDQQSHMSDMVFMTVTCRTMDGRMTCYGIPYFVQEADMPQKVCMFKLMLGSHSCFTHTDPLPSLCEVRFYPCLLLLQVGDAFAHSLLPCVRNCSRLFFNYSTQTVGPCLT